MNASAARRATTPLAPLLLLAACHDSTTESLAPGAGAPAEVRLVFPPSGAWTEAPALSVELEVLDPEGVAAVEVQGVAASATGNDRWQARVPLVHGANALAVSVTDDGGARSTHALPDAIVQRRPFLVALSGVAEGGSAGELLVLDARLRAPVRLAGFAAADALRAPLAAVGDGLGVELVAPAGLARDASAGVLHLADAGLHALVALEEESGLRTIVSGAGVGGGPLLVTPTRVLVDAPRGRLIALDSFAPAALLAVALADGERSLLSGPSQPGPALVRVVDLALDEGAQRVLALDAGSGSLLAVALADGARTVLSGPALGAGPPLLAPTRLALDAARGTAYVADAGLAALVEVDLASGARRLVALEGEPLRSYEAGLAVRADGALLVAERDALWRVDPASGAREPLLVERRGDGPALVEPEELALDLAAARVLLADSQGARLLALSLLDGRRELLAAPSDATLFALGSAAEQGLVLAAPLPIGREPQKLVALGGSPDPLSELTEVGGTWPELVLALATDGEAAYLAYPSSVRRVALDTLVPSTVSGAGIGGGPVPTMLVALAEDAGAQRLFAADAAAARVLAIALDDGQRTVLADLFTGSGPTLADPHSLEVAGERLIVLDRARAALVALDPASGLRVLLDEGLAEPGAPFDAPRDLARDPRDGLLYTLHGAPLSGLVVSHARTGERVLLAR